MEKEGGAWAVRLGMRYVNGMREASGKVLAAEQAHSVFTSIDDLARRVPKLAKGRNSSRWPKLERSIRFIRLAIYARRANCRIMRNRCIANAIVTPDLFERKRWSRNRSY